MADGVDIDLYADVDHEFSQEDNNGYASVDLYDDMVQPSGRTGSRSSLSNGMSRNNSLQYNYQGKKVSLYIGNLTWWTTDIDLQNQILALGINDLIEVKFIENRANGQSKGFAVVHLASENSSRVLLEKLPHKEIHGQNPIVTHCNRANLNQFEQQSKVQSGNTQSKPPAPAPANIQFSQPPPSLGTVQISVPPPMAPPTTQTSILGQPPPNTPALPFPPPNLPPAARDLLSQMRPPINIPPPRHGMHLTNVPPPQLPPHGIHGLRPPPNMPPPPLMSTRVPPPPLLVPPNVNTRVPPPMAVPGVPPPSLAGVPPPNLLSQLSSVPPPNNLRPPTLQPNQSQINNNDQGQQRDQYRSRSRTPPANDIEIEEAMMRNRAVSSTAISRAVADASSGDYGSAIETLVTAISLLKQSKMAGDERTKVLIGSLRDCLHGIEDKSFGSGGGSRKRDRSHDREERTRYRESKSRRRDRDRDRSRSRDRYEEREYRDRSRERDGGSGGYRHSDRHRR